MQTRGRKKRDIETVTSIGPAGSTSQTKPSAPEGVSDSAPNWDTTAELPTLQTAEEVRADRTDNHVAPPITPTRDSSSTASKRPR